MWRRLRSLTLGSNETTEYSFLLIGKTGNGKSSSGNGIINKADFFVSFGSSQACTKSVRKWKGPRWGKQITFVDTPGLFDTELDEIENAEFARKNMRKAFTLCPDGFNALLIVLNYNNRYNKEEKEVIEILTEIFGDEMFRSTILIFTHGDNFDQGHQISTPHLSQKEFMKWCRNVPGDLQILLQKCNYRAVLFHNNLKYDDERDLEMMELEGHVRTFKKHKYTKYHFDRNEFRRNLLILNKYLKQLKEKINKEIEELKDDLKLITHQQETLFKKTNKILDGLKSNSFPQKLQMKNATTDLLGKFNNVETNHEKFKFIKEVLSAMKSPICLEMVTLIDDINKILNPEKHKTQLKRKVSLLLEYIKEESHGTNKLIEEIERAEMLRSEIYDLETKGGEIVSELKY